ncbi:BTB/POZ domain-containing protein 9-like [Culicoides brevitarsis]|uniref:BTB/POZ domain-containing protein 9-like n=1 Tax=Culicoides brevitarsis TaxID=469753 RepID=UPI00307C6923
MENIPQKALRVLLIDQKRCDVFFHCKKADGTWSKYGAHKFWLSLVSDVFEAMFFGETVTNGGVTDETNVWIEDINFDGFVAFLRHIYGFTINDELEDDKTLVEFFCCAHKYNCVVALKFAEELMKIRLSVKNVLLFFEIADLYDLQTLRYCCRIMCCQMSEILSTSEFLTSKPATVNFLYGFPCGAINSEMDFVWALERYVAFNKKNDEKIAEKIRPALQQIHFLTTSANDISHTALLSQEEKKMLIGSLSSKTTPSIKPFNSSRKNRCMKKRIDMIWPLKDLFVPNTCAYCKRKKVAENHSIWNCSQMGDESRRLLSRVYVQYQHTNLIDYDLFDLMKIYNFFCEQKFIAY